MCIYKDNRFFYKYNIYLFILIELLYYIILFSFSLYYFKEDIFIYYY